MPCHACEKWAGGMEQGKPVAPADYAGTLCIKFLVSEDVNLSPRTNKFKCFS